MNRKYLLLCTSVSLMFSLSAQAKTNDVHYACVVGPNGKTATKISDHVIEKDAINEIIRKGGYPGPCATYADRRSLGNGYIQSYAQLLPGNIPHSIGLEFPASMLENLPTEPLADGNTCYDLNGDGEYQRDGGECLDNYEIALDLPKGVTASTSFNWSLINWNPQGHPPTGTYTTPHFDFHFYIQKYVDRNLIGTGPCSGLTSCAVFQKAIKDVPSEFMGWSYQNVQGVEARMGNHYTDLTSSEFTGSAFTHTFLYGSYDGHVTYWEPMVTLAFLQTKPNVCKDIKLPQAYEIPGYYPTQYCITYNAARKKHRISLEGFVKR